MRTPTRAVMLMLTLTTAMIASAQEPGLLLEDSFEQGRQAPEGWKTGANVQGVRYHYEQRRAKTGSRSLSLQKTAQRYFPIAQWLRTIPLKQGPAKIKVSVQVRAERATKAIVDVIFMDAGGQMISHEWASYIGSKGNGDPPANHNWKEYSGIVEIPAETKRLGLALQIYGPGKVWFDDLRVVDTDSSSAPSSSTPPALKSSGGEASAKPLAVKIGAEVGHYLASDATGKPTDHNGKALLVVLPGGDGSADFFPFVKRIQTNALPDDFVIAQPIAKKWSEDQVIVWPTKNSSSAPAGYTTEQLISAVIEDVARRVKIDRRRIFLLAWSSGGPAAQATLLQNDSPVAGGMIAMSVFKPKQLPSLRLAKNKRFFLLHSPDDRVCPYWMAKQAEQQLAAAGAETKLVDYEGGHGWRGNVYGNIRAGIDWLND